MTVFSSSGYAFYIGFTDGQPYGGSPTGLGIPAPTSPTAGDLYTGSSSINISKSAPNYPAMLSADWLLLVPGPTGLAGAGFTKLKISSPNLSETTIPIPSTTVSGLTFSAPTWVTSGTNPVGNFGVFTMKFIK